MSSSSRKSRHFTYVNAAYWPNSRIYNGDTPGQLNYGCINRVYYAFATVMADGGVFVSRWSRPGWTTRRRFTDPAELAQ